MEIEYITNIDLLRGINSTKDITISDQALIKQCILKSSKEGDIVFDGFGGSGTTAIACLETNRKYILVEKDPKYYEMSVKRVEEWHKEHPDGVAKEKDEKRYDRLPNEKENIILNSSSFP